MNPWPVIAASLLRYRYSVLAFVFLIIAGTALSVAIVSQERALKTGSAQAAEKFDLVVAPVGSRIDALLTSVYLQPGSSRLLSPEITAQVLNEPRAEFVSPLAFGDSYRRAPLVGVTAQLVSHLSNGALGEGRVFTSEHEAVIGADVDLALGTVFSPSHGVHQGVDDDETASHATEITVVGRMARTGSPWDRAIAVPVELVWNVHAHDAPQTQTTTLGGPYTATNNPGIPAAVIKANSVADAYRLRQAYNTDDSMAFFPAEVLIQLYQTLGDVREIMTLMAFVTQALVMLSIIASVLILFRLLMPQFVTLRAIGAPRLYIFAIAWGFVTVLFTVGVLLGVACGYLLSLAISAWLQARIGMSLQPALGANELLLGLGVWIMGLIIALFPAYHLQRKPLAKAMQAY